MKYQTFHVQGTGEENTVEVPTTGNHSFLMNGEEMPYEITNLGGRRFLVRASEGRIFTVDMDGEGMSRVASGHGYSLDLNVISDREKLLGAGGNNGGLESGEICVSMPGKIVKLLVAEGDVVEEGTPVLIAEAMKMENEVKSPCNGTVGEIRVSVGDTVEPGQLLARIEPEAADGEAS
jgi:biotin carboxyl carrier protein